MKSYTVQTLAWSSQADADAAVIAEGFNWWAFLLGPVWALWHGMWRTALALLIIAAVIGGLGSVAGLAPNGMSLLQILVQIGLGLWGNDIRRAALARRGYVERAVVVGETQRDAEQRYYAAAPVDAA